MSDQQQNAPMLTPQLIAWLDRLVPLRDAKANSDEAKLRDIRAQRELINKIRRIYKEQNGEQ